VLYLGTMVAQVETAKTTNSDVIGYITGLKTFDPELEGAAR
jgi:D-xylose transport system ATP-binding protein